MTKTKRHRLPHKTGVVAINIATGERHEYGSIRQCAEIGGWAYTSIRNVLHGRTEAHMGWIFEALSPLRQTKPNPVIVKAAKLRNQGLTNDEVADKLGIDRKTAPVYLTQAVTLGLTETFHDVQAKIKYKNRMRFIK